MPGDDEELSGYRTVMVKNMLTERRKIFLTVKFSAGFMHRYQNYIVLEAIYKLLKQKDEHKAHFKC
jgi:hypothetical protein